MIENLVDEGTWQPYEDGLASRDPLSWEGYPDLLRRAEDETGRDESVVSGSGRMGGHKVSLASFDFSFIGGSMGEVAGERIARAIEQAIESDVPFVLYASTGGARMQEGMRSLVQMPKVVAARIRLGRAGLPFIALLGHPTTGGVLASIGGLADATIAASGATVGFAGPRVSERFTGSKLTEGSHSAENAFIRGLVDEVADQSDLKETTINALAAFAADTPDPIEPPEQPSKSAPPEDAWSVVQAARSPERPLAHEMLLEMTESLFVLNGDRAGGSDPAVDTAIARIHGRRVVVLSLDRERSPGPAAYRKAKRAIEIAERLRIPVVSLVDTRGADPSEESEGGGIAWEIASLYERILSATVPTISVLLGEGGSGGALAFAATDVLVAYEGSFFSVIAPELAAEILWRDASRGPDAARRLRLSAHELLRLGIADELVPEPPDPETLKKVIAYHLGRLADDGSFTERRLDRWRDRFGDR